MSYKEVYKYIKDYEKDITYIITKVDIILFHHANISTVAVSNLCKKYSVSYIVFIHGTTIELRHHGFYDDMVWNLIP